MDNFKAELDHKLKGGIVTVFKFSVFKIIQIFNNHAPAKKKFLRFNNSPFVTKTLRKAIMHRSRLKNISVKEMIKIGKIISKEFFLLTSVKLKQNTLKI